MYFNSACFSCVAATPLRLVMLLAIFNITVCHLDASVFLVGNVFDCHA